MDGCIVKSFDYINENIILQIIRDKNLLDKKQSDNLKTIIEKEFIDNEVMIDIFYESKTLPLVGGSSYIKICNYLDAQEYITQGYFIYEDKVGNKITAINDLKLLFNRKSIFASLVLIKKYHFYKSLEKNFAHLNSIKAKYAFEFKVGPIIAKNINYANKVIIFFVAFIAILIYLPVLFHIANNISYCVQNILKSVLFLKAVKACKPVEIKENKNELGELPIYTILVPLYKELSKLRSIIKNISLINYPKNKLDVKIIIEEDDYLMIKEVALYNLPAYFHVILVPKSFPRTKPKALNYALEYSRGKYIVVYDAEDKPEADQLLKALAMFKSLPFEYICLQAKLNFYNKNENILTKMFNIEYSLWFKYILKGLSLLKLPMPLGGTSNHFKADILRKLGGWDAYNVTEDAELGIRIYSQGYKVAILDSYTLEEAPNCLGNWLNQRSRWIKGFLQTFFVFKAQKDKYKKFTLLQIITIYIFIGLSSYNFWCLPFVIFSIVVNKNSVINYLWLVNSIFSLLYLYGTAIYILKNSLKSQKVKKNFEREAKRSTTDLLAWIPNRHCERLQRAWQSKKNNKKCYKLTFFNWITSSKFAVFSRNDGIADTRNNASTALYISKNSRQDEFKVESAEELKAHQQRQELQKSFVFRFMEYVVGKRLRSTQGIGYEKGLIFQDLAALILWSGYFILHTVASYKAVFEIIFCPFKWSKTKHGVSVENFEDE